ncbi:MAG: phosphate signaling complex protein PhoU [Actinobacteria bacterium]|nr:phosphate signaling complex protein PhoU [Actinomycetota bacterium]
MVRKIFDRELKDLKEKVVMMSELVYSNVSAAIDSLFKCDRGLADSVINADIRIDELDHEIEEESIVFIARQQPVAIDLRMIATFFHVIISLERIGDLAVNIARATKAIKYEKINSEIFNHMKSMSEEVKQVLRASLDSFINMDIEGAKLLHEMDSKVDKYYYKLIDEFTKISQDEMLVKWASMMVLASRYLERIADNAVNIGDRITYLFTGDYQVFHAK